MILRFTILDLDNSKKKNFIQNKGDRTFKKVGYNNKVFIKILFKIKD